MGTAFTSHSTIIVLLTSCSIMLQQCTVDHCKTTAQSKTARIGSCSVFSIQRTIPSVYTWISTQYFMCFIVTSGVALIASRFLWSTSRSLHIIKTTNETLCVFYDKPPRTASTTIGNALSLCLQKKGYTALDRPISKFGRDEVVHNMLNKPGYKKSAAIKHVQLSHTDIQLLRENCLHLLYITSTRSMKERIASKAKYAMHKRHGNSSLTSQQYSKAVKKALVDNGTEPELEAYPFTSNQSMQPDYVIRADNFETDLNLLLRALGCETSYTSANVHLYEGEEVSRMEELDAVELKYSDATFKRLSLLADQRNSVGIAKAKQF